MILGIGIDVVRIDRIAQTLDRHGDRFRNRIFTRAEQERAESVADRVGFYAKRWAAKEACSKALGTGMRRGVAWRDLEVVHHPSGMHGMAIRRGALRRLTGMLPSGHEAIIHLSMTDDRPVAAAMVLIEARPAGGPGPLPTGRPVVAGKGNHE